MAKTTKIEITAAERILDARKYVERTIDMANRDLAEFAKNATENPAYAIEWGAEDALNAVEVRRWFTIVKDLFEDIDEVCPDNIVEAMVKVVDSLTEEITRDLISKPYRHNSTSVMANLKAEVEARTKANLLDAWGGRASFKALRSLLINA